MVWRKNISFYIYFLIILKLYIIQIFLLNLSFVKINNRGFFQSHKHCPDKFISFYDRNLISECIAPRTDHAAPARKRYELPEMMCLLMRETDLGDSFIINPERSFYCS